MHVEVERPLEFTAKGSDFGLGIWSFTLCPGEGSTS